MRDHIPPHVQVLDATVNAAVIKMPGRAFPGIVVQGDTLHSWSVLADSLMSRVNDIPTADPELVLDMAELADLIRSHIDQYENVLRAHGVDLPYST